MKKKKRIRQCRRTDEVFCDSSQDTGRDIMTTKCRNKLHKNNDIEIIMFSSERCGQYTTTNGRRVLSRVILRRQTHIRYHGSYNTSDRKKKTNRRSLADGVPTLSLIIWVPCKQKIHCVVPELLVLYGVVVIILLIDWSSDKTNGRETLSSYPTERISSKIYIFYHNNNAVTLRNAPILYWTETEIYSIKSINT